MKKERHATVLPPAPEIITDRPENMSFKDYKIARKESNQKIKDRLKKGFLVFLSNEVLFDEHKPKPRPIGMRYISGLTFKGNTRMLQIV